MIDKLPRWVWAGGAVLAFIAGVINAVGLLDFRQQAMTHMTGTTTSLGIAAAQGNANDAIVFVFVISAFVLGAALSGAIIGVSTLQLGRRYGVVLAIESVSLFCAVPLLQRHLDLGIYLATCACGLQNAMASTYSGAVLRTTHMSGIVTDLGVFLGQRLRGHRVDRKRAGLYLLLYSAFIGGGVAGACSFSVFGEATLYGPALLSGLSGLAYVIYWQRRNRVL
jgi:uncharacterized membrane protein YoaK (UPF0700 family)